MKIQILRENKKNCFQEKDFEAKSNCVQKQKGIPKDNSNAYVASVLRDKGELKKVEELEEISAMGGGGVAIGVNKKELDEMYSTAQVQPMVYGRRGLTIYIRGRKSEHEGYIEKSNYQGLRNVPDNG